MANKKMSNIPSDEDFARAERLDRERWRNVEMVRKRVIAHFKRICPLYDVCLLPQGDPDFRAYVFFEKDRDVEACKNSGIVQQMTDFVYAELELAGRGKRGDITVAFEFDSDENVMAKFAGDYFLRLR
jgi:hypothetical protein